MKTKYCTQCKEHKNEKYFNLSIGNTHAGMICSFCVTTNKKAFKKARKKSSNRVSHLQLNYGLSLEDYNLLFNLQNGCCKICERHQSEFDASLHIDHNHKTKAIRGLLCRDCNIGIGYLKDSARLCLAAAEYLKESS